MTILAFPRVIHRYLDVGGVRIFYRESIPDEASLGTPVLLLLHGFPSASHQFRRLIDAVGNRCPIRSRSTAAASMVISTTNHCPPDRKEVAPASPRA